MANARFPTASISDRTEFEDTFYPRSPHFLDDSTLLTVIRSGLESRLRPGIITRQSKISPTCLTVSKILRAGFSSTDCKREEKPSDHQNISPPNPSSQCVLEDLGGRVRGLELLGLAYLFASIRKLVRIAAVRDYLHKIGCQLYHNFSICSRNWPSSHSKATEKRTSSTSTF